MIFSRFKASEPTPALSEDAIRSAVRQVKIGGIDIIESGILAGLTFSDGKVSLVLQVDQGTSIDGQQLKKAAEEAIGRVPGVSSVSVVLTAHQASSSSTAAPARKSHVPEKIALPNVKYIVAVASGKGGVGKSTTAANLAVALALKGLKVGLLDADIYGPSVPRMMGLSGKPEFNDQKKMIPHERHGLAVMSIGFLVAEDQAMVWRGPMVHTAITQLFRDVAWGARDVLVVDLPPGTGDAQLTMAQSVPLAGAVIVSTPQDIALLDARKGIAMFQKVEVPILGLIENMSSFQCPNCGIHTDIFGHGGAQREAAKLQVPFLGEIPLDIIIRETSDDGTPVTLASADSNIANAYRRMADRLWTHLESQKAVVS